MSAPTKADLARSVEIYRKHVQGLTAAIRRLREQSAMWHGKYSLVKHENNKLRKREALLRRENQHLFCRAVQAEEVLSRLRRGLGADAFEVLLAAHPPETILSRECEWKVVKRSRDDTKETL